MRVVAGSARGRKLRAPAGWDTRPTGDRVREAVLNMLSSMDAIEDARVLDLFAGTGALGIEALSRGAAGAVFVDSDRRAVEVIRENLRVLAPERSPAPAEVVATDAVAWVGRLGPGARFDVCFADPPYAWDGWPTLLAGLAPHVGVLVAEAGAKLEPVGWHITRSRRYGTTVVTVAQPAEVHAPS